MSNSKRHGNDSGVELEKLLLDAHDQYPGIIDLLKAYDDYDQAMSLMNEYFETSEPEPTLTTSNQSSD